jgi:glycogen debranching enzyme
VTADPPTSAAPILLTSLASAALLDGRGDLELVREMRGAPTDCGGVIAQCVRLTGPWRLALRSGGEESSLPAILLGSERGPAEWVSRHRWNGFELVQRVAAVDGVPAVVRSLRCARPEGPSATLSVTSSFAPFLLPVLVEGIRPRYFRVDTAADELRIRQRGFALSCRSNELPTRLFLNRGSWVGGRYQGRLDEVGIEYELPVAPDSPVELRLLVAGGLDRTLDAAAEPARRILSDPSAAAAAVAAADRSWEEGTPTLRFPDAPALEAAYRSARASLRRLYAAPGDDLTGLVAGFPWYSAIWVRDLAWMLRAVLWLGDLDWVRRSIDTALRFQSRGPVPMLAGEAGELPMQLTPGPVFFYGTSDTTLYFPSLMIRWVEHAGAGAPPDGWKEGLRSMVAWGEGRSDPVTALLRNGGEAEEISAATRSLARVRYGIDSPDTTIWDSTDRRDHAIDVQVLWWETLGTASAILTDAPGDGSTRWRSLADRVAETIRTRYAWEREGYLYDSLRRGAPVEQLRPNALRAVSAGLVPVAQARRIVERAAADDLTTPWGVRTLSSRDPAYHPEAYHDGEVWTIATAWAADAALAVGDRDRGLGYLTTISERIAAEGGFANECYRGDRPEPFDSCFLLGFSVAPFLTVLFERLWGITIDARAGRLAVRPSFPAGWRSASVQHLRLGGGFAALDWAPGRVRVGWSGPGTISVDGGSEVVAVDGGATAEVALAAPP